MNNLPAQMTSSGETGKIHLGEERLALLQKEGSDLPFTQILALPQNEMMTTQS
jgi:hypothetical protein